jgi:hypothetical protein
LEQSVLIVLEIVPEYSIKSVGFHRYICSLATCLLTKYGEKITKWCGAQMKTCQIHRKCISEDVVLQVVKAVLAKGPDLDCSVISGGNDF